MTRPPHTGAPAVAPDTLVHPLRAFHVADNRRTRFLFEDGARERHHQLVAPYNAAVLIYRTDAVRVTVVSDPDIRLALFHLGDQIAHVVFDRGIGMMIGKAPIHLDIQA